MPVAPRHRSAVAALAVFLVCVASAALGGCSGQRQEPSAAASPKATESIPPHRLSADDIAAIEQAFAEEHDAVAGWDRELRGTLLSAEAHRLLVEPNRRVVWRGVLEDVRVEGDGYHVVLGDRRRYGGTSTTVLFLLRCSKPLGDRLLERHREYGTETVTQEELLARAREDSPSDSQFLRQLMAEHFRQEIVLAVVQPTAVRRPFALSAEIDDEQPSLFIDADSDILTVYGTLIGFRLDGQLADPSPLSDAMGF